jgi:Leucine-rich repeat (LRR) protein
MKRQMMNDFLLIKDDKIYAEAQRRIAECGTKRRKKLDLSCLYLTEIPPEIAGLNSLEELDLTCGSLKKIPGFIGNIVSLKKLLIGCPNSSPHKTEELILPAEFGNLRNLRYLSLGYNILEIPDWVWTLDNLEVLCVYNDLIETIPSAITNLKKLYKLLVYGDKISSLPGEIGGQLQLTGLVLKCPRLTALPESFANLKIMQGFRFDVCNLTSIPDYICGWAELEELIIDMENTFQGPYTNLKSIPKNIGNLKKLKYLSITGGSIASIPASLGDCPLEYVVLTGDFKIIPETFGKCSKLEVLKLFSVKPVSLPASFGNLAALKKLIIRSPDLEIPTSFGKLSALEELSIDTENDLVLPKSFGCLSSLKELCIDAGEMRAMPASICGCKNLKQFTLTGDKLVSLPQSFCELKKLEELHLDTPVLKSLPVKFGSLSALKNLDIFSGDLIALPESIFGLKKLKSFCLDAYNIKKLPDSFGKLSYVKQMYVQIGREKAEISRPENIKREGRGFDKFTDMGYSYYHKLFESYSLKKIESILCSAPYYSFASKDEKEFFKDLMLERRFRLNKNFKWTDGNKKRIVKVSDEFLKAWEDGFAKAMLALEALYEKERDKDSFSKKYYAEIVLYPEILFDDNDKYEEIYRHITSYLNSDIELSIQINCDPAAKQKTEDDFKEEIDVCRDLSWNIEGFGDIELKDHYICYALHVLYSHNHWAFKDMLKINNIVTEIKITCDNETF